LSLTGVFGEVFKYLREVFVTTLPVQPTETRMATESTAVTRPWHDLDVMIMLTLTGEACIRCIRWLNYLWSRKKKRKKKKNKKSKNNNRSTQPSIPPGVAKSSIGLWLGLRRGVFTCVGWKITLCDFIWQVIPRSPVMESLRALLFYKLT